MKISKIPFNITLLDPGNNTWAGMLPVQSMAMYSPGTGDFHPQGLYSDAIFGKKGEAKRDVTESFIPLKVPIYQPLYFKELSALKGLYREILMGKGFGVWNEEKKDFERSNMIEGVTGYAAWMDKWKDLVFQQGASNKRKLRIMLLEKFRQKALTTNYLVIPAGMRDVEVDSTGRPVENDINAFYRKLLAASNTIGQAMALSNSPVMDAPRAQMTRAAESIYDHIMNIMSGKGGLLRAKFARRRVHGSTRNVISSPVLGSAVLGDNRQMDVMSTLFGVYQFVKGTEDYIIYELKHGPFRQFFEDLDRNPILVDPETLQPTMVDLKQKTRDKFGTRDGLVSFFNEFEDGNIRHRPLEIEGHYLSLVYDDGEVFKYFNDISKLPEGFDERHVRPMSIGEFLYFHCKNVVPKTRFFITRYPIADIGSIYGVRAQLKSTPNAKRLTWLSEDWQKTDEVWEEYPDVETGMPYFASMAVHPVALGPLQGDYDGDQLSATPILSDEGVEENDTLMYSKSSYLSPTGGLYYQMTTATNDWLFAQLTGF